MLGYINFLLEVIQDGRLVFILQAFQALSLILAESVQNVRYNDNYHKIACQSKPSDDLSHNKPALLQKLRVLIISSKDTDSTQKIRDCQRIISITHNIVPPKKVNMWLKF